MRYNYIDVRWKNLNFSLLHFDYGEQQKEFIWTSTSVFSPSSTIIGADGEHHYYTKVMYQIVYLLGLLVRRIPRFICRKN